MKKNHIIVGIVILGVGILVGTYLYDNYNVNISSGEIVVHKKSSYDATVEIKQSLAMLSSSKKAEVLTNVNAASEIVSLSFEGLSDKKTMDKIINLLDK